AFIAPGITLTGAITPGRAQSDGTRSPPPQSPPPVKRTATTTYPDLSKRLNEQGTTLLNVTVGVDGSVVDAVVLYTSGYQRLDDASIEVVKRQFHYYPA